MVTPTKQVLQSTKEQKENPKKPKPDPSYCTFTYLYMIQVMQEDLPYSAPNIQWYHHHSAKSPVTLIPSLS